MLLIENFQLMRFCSETRPNVPTPSPHGRSFLTQEKMMASKKLPLIVSVSYRFLHPCRKSHVLSDNETSHRFEIPDFATRFASAVYKDEWKSDVFEVPGLHSTKFSLQFLPKGGQEENKASCGLCLKADDIRDYSRLKFQHDLWIENAEGRRSCKKREF